MKQLIFFILLTSLCSCAGNLQKAQKDAEADSIAQKEIEADFGSAFAGDSAKRLEFLKGKISEKREALEQLSQKELSGQSDVAQMTEILESEILLMEAERFNLQTEEGENEQNTEGLE